MLCSFLKSISNLRLLPFLFILERDAFDALFDNAPEKLNVVKKVLCECKKKDIGFDFQF